MAAGMTLAADRLPEFRERLERVAMEEPAEVFVPNGRVDMELTPDLIGEELIEALKQLEPHGPGNPAPTFALRGTDVELRKVFGKEQNHARLRLGPRLEGIFWRGAQFCRSMCLEAGTTRTWYFRWTGTSSIESPCWS